MLSCVLPILPSNPLECALSPAGCGCEHSSAPSWTCCSFQEGYRVLRRVSSPRAAVAQGSPGCWVRLVPLRGDGSWDTSARLLLHICRPAAAHLHSCCTSACLLLHTCCCTSAHLLPLRARLQEPGAQCATVEAPGCSSPSSRTAQQELLLCKQGGFSSEASELAVLFAHVFFSLLVTVVAFIEAMGTVCGQCSLQSWDFAFKMRHLAQTLEMVEVQVLLLAFWPLSLFQLTKGVSYSSLLVGLSFILVTT